MSTVRDVECAYVVLLPNFAVKEITKIDIADEGSPSGEPRSAWRLCRLKMRKPDGCSGNRRCQVHHENPSVLAKLLVGKFEMLGPPPTPHSFREMLSNLPSFQVLPPAVSARVRTD